MKIQVVFDLILDANILSLAVVTVPFAVGVWWKKANRTGALAAMAAGFAAWALTAILAPSLPGDFIGLAACSGHDPDRHAFDAEVRSADPGRRL